ncbi:MAG: indole-3-glycerol phosphate synthase TrpC [Candidatus Altiarchaeales archaeon]|nr:indole-3-glycerol phosphate synthase TrpC [Candidatus Altiarchaeales archaeon]MBD3415939.1 indole-3-glycerol phosphate synthase TrpC [Candidatus Altiarchaeales archaeon]
MSFLDDIVGEKRVELERKRRSLVDAVAKRGVSVIAEVKRRSPSDGELNLVDSVGTAVTYESSGASAISVLTDEKHFGGTLNDLKAVKAAVDIPVLRKDFIVDELQLYESLVYRADAVLLIAAILKEETPVFVEKARLLGLDCLVEVHDEDDLKYALSSKAKLIGVNNRNLETFEVDLAVTENLAPMIPKDRLIVAESGVHTREDVLRMKEAGADAILVGTSLMRSGDLESKMRELLQ